MSSNRISNYSGSEVILIPLKTFQNLTKAKDKHIMDASKDTIVVNANVEMTTGSLQTIVEKAKQKAGRDEKGVYRVDTADKVSEMISRFLLEKDFEGYVRDSE